MMKSVMNVMGLVAAVEGYTATYHAELSGTTSVPREVTLQNLGCADALVGWGKPGIIAAQMAARLVSRMGIHITSSSLGGRYGCGACLKVSTDRATEYCTVVDIGGKDIDLHPELFFRLFGVDETVVEMEPFWPTEELRQRYKGMGGVHPLDIEVVDGNNCPGYPAIFGGSNTVDEDPEPEPVIPVPAPTPTSGGDYVPAEDPVPAVTYPDPPAVSDIPTFEPEPEPAPVEAPQDYVPAPEEPPATPTAPEDPRPQAPQEPAPATSPEEAEQPQDPVASHYMSVRKMIMWLKELVLAYTKKHYPHLF